MTGRASLRRLARRHRRPLAAVLAGLGMVLGLSALGQQSDARPIDGAAPADRLRAGEVAVPIALASAAISATVHAGDIIDVVGIFGSDSASARVVAPRARVIEVPSGSSMIASSSSAIVVVAVPEATALRLSAASAEGTLTVLIRD